MNCSLIYLTFFIQYFIDFFRVSSEKEGGEISKNGKVWKKEVAWLASTFQGVCDKIFHIIVLYKTFDYMLTTILEMDKKTS